MRSIVDAVLATILNVVVVSFFVMYFTFNFLQDHYLRFRLTLKRFFFPKEDYETKVLKFLEAYQRVDHDELTVRPWVEKVETFERPVYQLSVRFSMCAEGENPQTSRYTKDGKVYSETPPYDAEGYISTFHMTQSDVQYRGLSSLQFVFHEGRSWAWNVREFNKFVRDCDRDYFEDLRIMETVDSEFDSEIEV